MRIGFDAHVLDGRDQGSKTVLLRVIDQLALRHPDQDFYIYAEREHPELDFSLPNLHFRPISYQGAVRHLISALPKAYRADKLDTMVFNYIASPFIKNATVIFHDVLPISHPKYFSLKFVLRCLLLYGGSSTFARNMFTVSHYSREQIRKYFPWTRRNEVIVMPIGASFHETTYLGDHDPSALPAALHGAARYALLVGRIEARKNTQLAVDAFCRGAPSDVRLVIVGRREPEAKLDLHEDPRIIELAGLSDGQLAEVYRNADLFLYPSSAEGFGLPLLDAILFGLPVISSNRTSMAEVGGEAVAFFDPEQPGALTWLADQIKAHFCGQPVPAPAAAQRQERAARYSWANAADTLVRGISRRRGSVTRSPMDPAVGQKQGVYRMSDSDRAWKEWGELDPYFAVLTDRKFSGDNLSASIDEFFASGGNHITAKLGKLEHYFGKIEKTRALDFGCGVGRLVFPLATIFDEVVGVDISPAMLAEAANVARTKGVDNVKFVGSDDQLSEIKGQFDFIHSYIVLQHIPAVRGLSIIAKLLDSVAPGGGVSLHMSACRNDNRVQQWRYWGQKHVFGVQILSNLVRGRRWREPLMQMNEYHLPTVLRMFADKGFIDIISEVELHDRVETVNLIARRR